LDAIWLDQDNEHFGFHDGIAQPNIAGFAPQGVMASGSASEMPAGEVLLGYQNAYAESGL
jgi:hypothetical protein